MPGRNVILVEDAQIRSRNFSGKPGTYNAEGQRNFLLLLREDLAASLADQGFNVKVFNKRPGEEEEPDQPFIKVKVNMNSEWPPKLYLVTSKGKTLLGADDLSILDWSQITQADIILNPSVWRRPDGTETHTLYLEKGYFTIFEDDLDKKYAEVSDSAQSAIETRVGFVESDEYDD